MTISFKQHAPVHFIILPSFNVEGFKDFIDRVQSKIAHKGPTTIPTTIRFLYHVMVLSDDGEEPLITYANNTQTHT